MAATLYAVERFTDCTFSELFRARKHLDLDAAGAGGAFLLAQFVSPVDTGGVVDGLRAGAALSRVFDFQANWNPQDTPTAGPAAVLNPTINRVATRRHLAFSWSHRAVRRQAAEDTPHSGGLLSRGTLVDDHKEQSLLVPRNDNRKAVGSVWQMPP